MTEMILNQPRPVFEDPRWTRIVARDKSADGQLWYSVSTTGIYCRPSCPSRAANPKNVQLHDTLADARATGFRPCLRCNPEGPSVEAGNAALVEKACRLIEESEEEPSLEELADAVGRSPSYFHRLFKASIGLTPKDYAAARRARKVRQELSAGTGVTEAIYGAGFNSSSRFYEKATDLLGMTPSRYRAGGIGEEIRFAVGETSLGAILVASSTKGVVAILLGDDPDALVRDLQDRFPRAGLIGADAGYEDLVARGGRHDRGARHRYRPPARRARHRLPGARLAGVAGSPGRNHDILRRDRAPHRIADSGSRGRRSLCGEQPRGRHSLPPRRSQRRCAFRLCLGRGA